jgi:pimeloyl-ACP methyl ester carboxylesterase
VDLYLDREAFPEAFAADVDPETARGDGGDPATVERRRGGHTLGPAGVVVHPVVVAAGHRGPSHPAGGQRFMAERGNARIEEVAASHASMVSQPEAVTRLILSAVEETSRIQP